METPLSKLIDGAVAKNRPLWGSIDLTYSCNLHCKFCYNPVERKGQERARPVPKMSTGQLGFGEVVKVMDQMKDLGVLYLTLTGGEPMVHPSFWEIAWEAKRLAFSTRIFTNGTLVDERAADRFAELCPYCLEISLHGAKESTAEALNQVPGSHKRLLQGLGFLKERGVRVFLKCVVTSLVENELVEMKTLAESYGFPLYFDPVLTISDDGDSFPLQMQASDETLKYIFSAKGFNLGTSPFERKPGEANCMMASGTLHVDPYGNVQPCVQWNESAGNIREKTLSEIWNTSPLIQNTRKLNLKARASITAAVPGYEFCAHCPALSRLRYGDPLRPEEQYLRVARILKQVWEEEGSGPTMK